MTNGNKDVNRWIRRFMQNGFAKLVLAIVVLLPISISCSKSKDYGLPIMAKLGSCMEEDMNIQTSGCAWAWSIDALVWGTLSDVSMVSSPAYNLHEHELVDECDGSVNHAMILVVDVDRSILGDANGKITVHVGERQVSMFYPRPVPDGSGGVDWDYGAYKDLSEAKPLGPGLSVGMALHRVEKHALWSLMGEPLLGLDDVEAGNTVVFQEVLDECGYQPPVELEGLDLETFIATVRNYEREGCRAEAEKRETFFDDAWGRFPNSYMAAVCLPDRLFDGDGDSGCVTNADCSPDLSCIAGVCQ